ncbi:zinc metalloprotease Rip [soil metagenome]
MTDTTEIPPPPPPTAPRPGEGHDGPDPHGAGGQPERATSTVRLAVLVGLIVALGVFAGVSALIVVAALIVMIFLHELGHYLTATSAGMKVTEFFIGFGPRIWSFTRGETEYGVKAIPAGAYVKIIGMHNLEEVDPADEGRTYRQKSYWRRMSVAVAGSTMHFLIALSCIFVLLAVVGLPGGSLLPDDDGAQLVEVGEVSPDSGAEAAGVEPGDLILGADGERFDQPSDVTAYIAERPGERIELTVERDGEARSLSATIGEDERDGETVGLLGVAIGVAQPEVETVGPLAAVPQTFGEFGEITVLSLEALGGFFTPSGLADFGDQVLSANDPEPVADPGSGAAASESPDGENRFLSIYGATRLGAQLTDSGAAGLLFFLITINIFIGMFNLVPLLPLDGGHVAIGTYERIRELLARRRTRYFADVTKLLPLTYLVILLMAGLFFTTLYLDIANPIDLG